MKDIRDEEIGHFLRKKISTRRKTSL